MVGMAGCAAEDQSGDASKKKVLYFGQQNAKVGLDCQKQTNSGAASIADAIFESLLRWTEDNVLEPVLLTEIPHFEADGLTLHCTLKKDIRTHDGETLTAHDVLYSFERMFKPETKAKSTYMYDLIKGAKDMLAGKAEHLEGLTVEDDQHFTFVLESPMTTFINNLGISYAHIFPKKACEAAGEQWGWGLNCVGTGKYKVVANDDTTEVVLARFDEYHGGKPALDEVHFRFFDDNNTRLLAFKAGEIDWCDVPADLIAQYKKDPEVSKMLTFYDQLGVWFINPNLKEGNGFEDKRVREALSIAINREELVETVLSGAGSPASGWLAPQTPGHDSKAKIAYDPERARQLLKEAGAENLTFDCKFRKGVSEKYMTAIQSYWKEIGVTVNLSVIDNGVWSSDWAAGNLQMTTLGWFPLYADADNHMYTYFLSANAKGKSSFYKNEKFDELVSKARVSVDQDERKNLYLEADALLTREDWATIPLYWPKGCFAARPYVKNAKVGNLIYHVNDIDIDVTDPSYTR